MKYAKKNLNRFLAYFILLVMLFFVLLPFYWTLITSLKKPSQIENFTSIFWPNPLTFENYRKLFEENTFLNWASNSLLVAFTSTFIAVAASALAAYSMARFKFRGRTAYSVALLAAYLVPPTLLFIPLYSFMRSLGMGNSIGALIICYPTLTIPFCTWLLTGFFQTIPKEIEEVATVDGASRFQVFLTITLPLAVPGLFAAFLYAFTVSWSEFLYALVFITDTNHKTIPAGMSELVLGDVYVWGQLMACSVLSTIPVSAAYVYLHKFLVRGLTAGAVRG